MDILISPNSFKGTLSSVEASDIIAEGLLKIDQNIKFKKLPIYKVISNTGPKHKHSIYIEFSI